MSTETGRRASPHPRHPVPLAGSLVMVVLLSTFLLVGSPADEKRLSIYSSAANYTLQVSERNGQDYVGLFEMLEPLGRVTAKVEGSRWKLRYNDADGEFMAGKSRARIRGRDFDLPANFLLENGRGLVPLACLSTLMPRFLGGPVTFHETGRRLFIGSVAVHFTAQMNKANPPSLVMDFSSPVNPMIATEPGQLRMVFTHEPLVPPGSQTLTFGSKTIPSANYVESNGTAEITVTGAVPLFASFSNDGRTITVAPAPQTATQATRVTAPLPGVPPANPPVQPTGGVPGANLNQLDSYFAVVDASHGGDERGAALSDQLAEKDVTLAFARRLRQELEARGITALLVRDGDTTISLDQRANTANSTRAKVYICVHATSQGNGVRLYSSLIPAGGASRGPFIDWDTAQSSFLSLSQSTEASVASEFQRRQIPARTLVAALRPLNNITAAAIGLEIAPPSGGISELNSPAYQQLVANSVAAGLIAVRGKLEAGR